MGGTKGRRGTVMGSLGGEQDVAHDVRFQMINQSVLKH